MSDCYHDEHVSGLHRIGARPQDALEFIRSVETGHSITENAVASFQQRWYGDVKQKYAMELTRHFARRFRTEHTSFLPVRQFACSIDPVLFPLVNHFFMLMTDPYYRWTAVKYLPGRYAQGRLEVTNTTFVPELRKQLPASIGTRTAIRYAQSILTALRDNGLLTGAAKKKVTPPEISVCLLAFFLYYHAGCGIGAGAFEKTPLFASLLRSRESWIPLFGDGERLGYWDFIGDKSRLAAHLSYADLDAWLAASVKEAT